jgi:hypothetical protein
MENNQQSRGEPENAEETNKTIKRKRHAGMCPSFWRQKTTPPENAEESNETTLQRAAQLLETDDRKTSSDREEESEKTQRRGTRQH